MIVDAPDQAALDRDAAAPAGFWPMVFGGWAAASLILVAVTFSQIAAFRVLDSDDWMRLLEVRDLLAGQSWWDVAQHRLNGGDFPMHWSRLVDLPIAAVIASLAPLIGELPADRVAMTLIPLLTLLAIMAGTALLARRLGGLVAAQLSIPLVPLAVPVLLQVRPMRIDHHGWQIALAVWAVAGLASRQTARHGALTGLALATLVTISLEGLPITVVIAGVAALAWVMQPLARAAFTRGLAAVLAAATLVFHLATRGPAALTAACDAMSPPYLVALGLAASGLLLATALGRKPLPVRFAAMALAGILAAAAFAAMAPACMRGPFAALDPLVNRYWYLNVLEGMPVWRQGLAWTLLQIALPVAGLAGAGLAWRHAADTARTRWTLMIAVQAAAFGLGIWVTRAGGTANALAVPGAAVLFGMLLARARSIEAPLPRILATVGSVFVATPGILVGLILPLIAPQSAGASPADSRPRHLPTCNNFADVRAIARLPASTVFAPIDLTPEILVNTHHLAIGAGYHRGAAAMRKVIAAFTDDPAHARPIVIATGARYVVACAGSNETDNYRIGAPNGLWARLERGERIAWLRPVAIPGSPVRVWRVSPPPAAH